MEHPPPPLAVLERDLDALRAAWAGSQPAFGGAAGGLQVQVEQMSDAGLVQVTELIARARRDADALMARVAAEIARRSDREFGEVGLAKAQGFHNPVRLIAATTGASRGDAAKLIAVGVATAERASFTGGRLPSKHPHVADALERAAISVDAASAITSMLDRVALRADPEHARLTEAALVCLASQVPLETLQRGVREAEARLDADGVEPRDELLRQERSLTIREQGNGMVHLHARLDPETAAPIKAAIEALVTDVLRRRDPSGERDSGRDGAGADPDNPAGPIVEDLRTIPQIQADALAMLAQHTLGCRTTLPPLAKTTVIVRMNLDALIDGLGHASIDGLDQSIPASTARRMAADAELIPAVLGGDSLPLDLGRGARYFTRAQRLALTERDGGCASCNQNIGYVDAHHIRWWHRDTGPTDLSNGVMLCSFCHHRIHREGWQIQAGPTKVWFIPPPHVDPARTPRLGGRARFALPDTATAA
ncbi:HNH endonuclease [Agromyces sp. SYSU K20354]|uniref:HNH endonuclease signature motif containing protein n=1 Tax=Agromyces cavernae TaxID=2898659 RepID=UPI001E393F96|nr:HNH endonuclease signature motif containing protein [Agromyces cavernae]MCD2441140.1 HNH endonuclease [Agromyces cavernae]